MNKLMVDIRDLRSMSVLSEPAQGLAKYSAAFSFRGSCPLKIGQFGDVLYLPEIGIQIINNEIVPFEATLDDYALQLVQERHGGTDVGVVEFDEVDYRKGSYCILANCFSRNFAHWTEETFKVLVLEDFGFEGQYVTPSEPAYCSEFLKLVGIESDRIVSDVFIPTVFQDAFYSTAISHSDVLKYPDVAHAFRETVLDACSESFHLGGRIWLQRKASVRNQQRYLCNFDLVREVLNRYAFNLVDIAAYPLVKQVAAMRATQVLAGPHGAGFVHSLFMDPGSTVIECFSPVHLNPSCMELYLLMGHRYHQIVPRNTVYSPYRHGHNLELDPVHLELVFRMLE